MRTPLLLLCAAAALVFAKSEVELASGEDVLTRDPEEFLLIQVDSVPEESLQDAPSHRQPSLTSFRKPLCSSGNIYIRPETELPGECSSQADCPHPYFCDRGPQRESAVGYCCLMVSEQEPPPVGCPFGTRPLKSGGNTLVTCTPGLARYNGKPCPGDAQCYFDAVEKVHKCCGRDPGEGCPSGSKAIKTSSGASNLICTPGDVVSSCPSSSLCQWSYLIDRYQCCESDNGCPNGMVPQVLNNQVQSCTPGTSTSGCAVNHSCEFNFWTASYQCCGRDYGLCPVGQVSYLEAGTLVARTCQNVGQSSTCPTGYVCTASSTGQPVCCGQAGQCPGGFQRVVDSEGRVASCSPTSTNSCTSPASCQAASGSIIGQYLCCSAGTPTSSACPSGRQPFPSAQFPQSCGVGYTSCPIGMFCETSASLSRSICCNGSPGTTSACPNGYGLSGGVAQYCIPTLRQCRVDNGASCQPSTVTAQQYLCCVPNGGVTPTTTYQCFLGTPVMEGGRNRVCSTTNPTCPGSATCQAAQGSTNVFVCCNTATNPTNAYTCPGNLVAQTPTTLCANLPNSISCGVGYLCEPAVGRPGENICCRATTPTTPVYTCQSGTPYATVAGINGFCSVLGAVNQCSNGYSCQRAANSASTLICCSGATTPTTYTCPASQTAYTTVLNGQLTYPQCATPGFQSNCPNGYTCQSALNAFGRNICCRSAVAQTFLCPNGVSAQTAAGGGTQTCAPGNTAACGNTFTCQPASNNPSQYICCQALANAAPQCPNGVQAYTVPPTNTLSYCTQLNPTCPQSYSCQQATNRQGTFLCCYVGGSTPTVSPTCPDGFTPYHGANNNPVYCNSYVANGCPSNSVCLTATNPGVANQPSICCQSGTGNTVCPSGGSALLVGGQVQYCIGPNGQCSTAGYTCQVSALLGRFVCCTSTVTTIGCSNGQSMYRPSGNVFYCNQNSGTSACPGNYDCQASNQPSKFVCCLRSTNAPSRCSSGKIPYRPAGNVIYCQPGLASICPTPATSCEASDVANSYICCSANQTPTSLAQCPVGWEAYTPPGSNSAQTCASIFANTCPAGYSCAQSTVAGVIQCCRYGTATTLRCYNGGNAQLEAGSNNPKYCNVANPDCQVGYSCQASTQTNTFICCQSSANPPVGITCPSGGAPDNQNGAVQFCTSGLGSSIGCGSGSTCQQSSRAGYRVCCSAGRVATRAQCIGRNTLLNSGVATACQLPNTCPNGYECSSYTTNGAHYCCAVTQNQNAPVCPGDAVPYRAPDTNQLHYCSNTNYKCPDGFVCKEQVNSLETPGEYICCSGKPGCQRGWLPYLDSRSLQKTTCSPFDANPCAPTPGPPYKCQLSTVPGTYLCCMESMIDLIDEESNADAPPSQPRANATAAVTQAPEDEEKDDFEGPWKWVDGVLVNMDES